MPSMCRPLRSLVLLAGLLAFLPGPARADDADADRVIRLVEQGSSLGLDIALREMVPVDGKGPRIWLVGVIHIADADYYRRLQSLLDLQPLVLYEAVLPEGLGRNAEGPPAVRVEVTRARLRFLARLVQGVLRRGLELPASFEELAAAAAKVDGRLAHLVARGRLDAWGQPIQLLLSADGDVAPSDRFCFRSLGADGAPGGEGVDADLVASTAASEPGGGLNVQAEVAKLLGIAWQGAAIDYGRSRWRPSDMSFDELRRAVEARGGDVGVIEDILDAGGLTGFALRVSLGLLKLTDAFLGGDVKLAVKAGLIRGLGTGPVEPEPGPVLDAALIGAIIEDRNGVVLEDLDRLRAERPDLPSVAVFYGAGHLPDFERRLVERGYERGRTRWLRALTVDLADAGPLARQMQEEIENEIRKSQ